MKKNDTILLAKKLTGSVDLSIQMINILSGIAILLIGIIYFMHVNRPTEKYFAMLSKNNLTEMQSLEQLNVSPKALLNWAMVAVTNAYTIDFLNYKNSLANTKEFFTENGYESFSNSLKASGRLQEIISNKLISSAVIVDSPIILKETSFPNNNSWEIQLPITITFQGASVETYKQWLIVTILVKSVPTDIAVNGIGIEAIHDISTQALF